MLPRVATTIGTTQPSPALPAGAAVDAVIRPQLSAAALANLRAEVLLRLLESLLKHMPRGAEPSPTRDLLETLLVALKTLPGRDGENGGKLADLIAKLPPALRPSVEKLIGTVLSAMPTRSLVEIVRNPNGPEAQKLAHLLTTSLNVDDGDLAVAGAQRQQKPLGLTAQQLAAVGRHGAQPTAQATHTLSDARALQTALKRLFDLDGNSKPRPTAGRASETATGRQELAGASRLPVATTVVMRTEPRLPTAAAGTGDQPAVDASGAALRHKGDAEDARAATPAVKREETKAQAANATGQALARSVLQAVARDVPPALLMQAVAHLVENLSPEEANFLRTLLERPFEPVGEPEADFIDQPEQQALEAETASEGGKPRPEATQSASRQIVEQDEPLPMPQAREAAQPAAMADAAPDRLLPALLPREGVPLAFVPYLPAEEDLAWPETSEAEQEDEDQTDSEAADDGGAQEDAEPDQTGDEPEADDMARKRERTAEMVGVIEPGLVFYQKLGDYWT